MKYAFNRDSEGVDLKQWRDINREMRTALEETIQGLNTRDELAEYFRQAIRDGKPLAKNPQMLFWGYDEPHTMPSDGRCEFFYMPTYIMMQTMMAGILQYPDLLEISGLPDTLRRGLFGCTGRNLHGHGFDDKKEQIENMHMFLHAGTKEFLEKYPDVSPEFTKLFNEIITSIRSDYERGEHSYGWLQDLKDEQRELIEFYDSL